jgi:hypothetical protein
VRKKAIYMVYYFNSSEMRDFTWFIGYTDKNKVKQAIKAISETELFKATEDNIIDIFEVSNKDIDEVYSS